MKTFVNAIVISMLVLTVFTGKGRSLRCSSCSTLTHGYSCLTHPPTPQQCPHEDNYCLDVISYHMNGEIKEVTKACSRYGPRSFCIKSKHGHRNDFCYFFCSSDYCNYAFGLHTLFNLAKK